MSIETKVFKNCDYLLVVSRRMKEYVTRKMGVSKAKVIVTPNGSEPQQFTAHYSKPLKAVYAGAFRNWEKVDDFLNIAKYADPKTFRFYLAGDGPLRKKLLDRIRKENINVTFLGYIPRQKMLMALSKMQVGIAPSVKDLARQVASPIKVYDYLAAGLPVVTPKIGDWGDLIAQKDCGIAVTEDGVDNYVKAMDALCSEIFWKRKSKNALKVVRETYDWRRTLEPLVRLLLKHAKSL